MRRVWNLACVKQEAQFGAFIEREGVPLPPGAQRRDLIPGDLVLVVGVTTLLTLARGPTCLS